MKKTTIYYYYNYNSGSCTTHMMCKSFSLDRILRPMNKLKVIPRKAINIFAYPSKNRQIFYNAEHCKYQVKEITCEKR
jgi:hypothetical protein